MSFEARNLRIQLPCHQVTILDCGVGHTHICGNPTIFCQFPTQIGCWQCSCGFHGSCGYHFSCGFVSPCGFGSPCGPLSPCPFHSRIPCDPASPGCGFGSPIEQDPGTLVINPEQIAVLRETLEAQLKELDEAESKLREFREKEGSG